MNQQIAKLFDTYGVLSSFDLAKKLELKIQYVDFPEPIYGYYNSVLYTEPLLININLSMQQQARTCEYLLVRHLLYTGIEFCLDEETFKLLELMMETSQNIVPLYALYQST